MNLETIIELDWKWHLLIPFYTDPLIRIDPDIIRSGEKNQAQSVDQ